jgi:hypothetical protein
MKGYMKANIEQFPAINLDPDPGPIWAKDGAVLYSNDVGEPYEW